MKLESVTQAEVEACKQAFDTCECQPTVVQCLYGPDAKGQLWDRSVSLEEAQKCDKAKCTCESHGGDEYVEIRGQRETLAKQLIDFSTAKDMTVE